MTTVAGIPGIILELIIDALICSMYPLPIEALAAEDSSVIRVDDLTDERRAFWSMCLVHRTWTDLARRGLWYRAVISRDYLNFLKLSVSTQNFLLVKELALLGSEFHEPYANYFAEFLRHTPNLRKLYLDMEVEDATDPGFLDVMQQLRMCERLENLWIVGDLEGCYPKIALAVSHLPQLRSLVVDSVCSLPGETAVAPEEDPPKNLKSIALINVLEWPYLSWLIRPHDGYNILNLSLTLDDPAQLEEDPDIMEPFHQCLAQLQSLCISTNYTDRHTEFVIHNESLGKVLSTTRSLSRFTLTVNEGLLVSHLRLPDTVTFFHIHHDVGFHGYMSAGLDDFRPTNDRNIASVVSETRPIASCQSSTSSLKKLVLSFIGDVNGIENRVLTRLEIETFAETKAACHVGGVSLTFELYASPYFGTIAESAPFVG